MLISAAVANLLVESGIYFLLIFTPFAFGGVERWAEGVLQIVAAIVVMAWALGRGSEPASRAGRARVPITLWAAIGLFLLLVFAQLVPLPRPWIRSVAPGIDETYVMSVPGYAEGRPFRAEELVPWLLSEEASGIPADPAPAEGAPRPPLDRSGFPSSHPARRTLSVVPFETWNHLALVLAYVGLFAVATDRFRKPEAMARLLRAAVFSGFAVSLFGIVQRATWNGKLFWIREGEYGSPFGPFVNRNSYAVFAAAVLPAAICMAFAAMRRMRREGVEARPQIALWGFAAVTMAAGICLSLSRGGILVAALSMVVVAAMTIYFGRHGGELTVLGIVAIGIVVFLIWIGPEKVIERMGTLAQGQSIPSIAHRSMAWERAVAMAQVHPLLGTGLGTFRYAFMRHAPPGEAWWTTAHNDYLELLCDTGLAGGVLVLAAVAIYLYYVARPRLFRGRRERYAYVAACAGLLAILVHATANASLQVPAIGTLFSVMSGALLGLSLARREGR